MSLVIARKYGEQIFIVSDTKLTDAYGKKIYPTQGVIKSIIVSPHFCLCFAGIADYADNALKSFRQLKIEEDAFNQAVQHFFNWHTRVQEKTEFILAFGKPHYKIVEIKDGGFAETANSWIGDDKAFRKFQGYFHNAIQATPTPLDTATFSMVRVPEPQGGDNSNDYSRMLNSMMAVITDTDIKYVGDFAVVAAYDKGSFQYMDYAYVLTNPIRWDAMPEEFVIPFGTTEEGGYGFNFIGALDGNTSIAAMYFLQGNLGILFAPQDGGLLQPIPIRNVPPIEFVEKVQEDFKVKIGCMFVGADTYGSRGRRRWEAGDYEGALADYNMSIEMDAKDPRSFRGRAMVYEDIGNTQNAISDWTTAIELEPTHAPTYRNRGLTFGRIGNLDEAISDCTKAIELNPNYAPAYRTRAIAYSQKGDIVLAQKDLKRFAELAN